MLQSLLIYLILFACVSISESIIISSAIRGSIRLGSELARRVVTSNGDSIEVRNAILGGAIGLGFTSVGVAIGSHLTSDHRYLRLKLLEKHMALLRKRRDTEGAFENLLSDSDFKRWCTNVSNYVLAEDVKWDPKPLDIEAPVKDAGFQRMVTLKGLPGILFSVWRGPEELGLSIKRSRSEPDEESGSSSVGDSSIPSSKA